MTTADLLSTLAVYGVRLVASDDGTRLGVQPAGSLSPDVRASVIDHKAALLAMLRGEALPMANPFADPRPRTKCDRCGSDQCNDVPIHDGQSLRRDCGRCGRFLGWPRWRGKALP